MTLLTDSDASPRLALPGRHDEPTPEHRAVYDTMHAQFLASFDPLRPVFEALNP